MSSRSLKIDIFFNTLWFNPPTEGFPGTISVKFLPKGHRWQDTKWRRNIAENFNRLSRVHERYRRQTTDGSTTTYSEHEHEFTFANKTVFMSMSDFFAFQIHLCKTVVHA